jgi:phosphohistidine swiveling domain-containing protein
MKFKKAQKAAKLDRLSISKFWEREFSIFTMSCWQFSLDIVNHRRYGRGTLSVFICSYQDGIAKHFRSRVEENKFEAIIGEKFIQSSKFRKKVFKLHDCFAKKLLNLYQQINKIDKINSVLLKKFNVWAGRFFGYNTLIQRGVDYIGKTNTNKKLTFLLIKQRTKYERTVVSQYENYLGKICKKAAKEKNITSPGSLKLLILEEFMSFIKSGKLPSNLKKRNKASVLIFLPKTVLLVGKSATMFIKKLEQQDRKKDEYLFVKRNLKGTPVYPGKTKGRVQVIINLKDLNKFKPGNILVAPTTLPKYTHLIKEAKGIITDEGGLLSHGAILSREYKIPCIIGTKIATQVLKDGDLVEVDANNGVVKILK